MKKIAAFILFMFCLTACVVRDNLTGEPCVRVEYTLNGERVTYEDWGGMERSFISTVYRPHSEGAGLYSNTAGNQGVASFSLYNELVDFYVSSDRAYFLDSKRYSRKDAGIYFHLQEGTIQAKEGWYCFTRNTSEPYCRYEVHFEFTCQGQYGTYEITDGVIQVGRRFQSAEVKNLIRSSE